MELRARGASVALDLSVGHIAGFDVLADQRVLSPLHRAPWVDDPAETFPDRTPDNVKRLSGDFFCAPFGLNDVEPAPSHGWPANSPWHHESTKTDARGAQAQFRLEKTVQGASLEKRLTLIDGHPFLYQDHVFTGGSGRISVSHHVMTRIAGDARLAFSSKAFAETPPDALEPDPARGNSLFAYPATASLDAFPLRSGEKVNLHHWPYGSAHEDFLVLAEARREGWGWTVVSRVEERDRLIIIKSVSALPVTMLWMSNGGRAYAPWSGRHTGVLGIEDACASPRGHADSIADNTFTKRGIPTAVSLGKEVSIRHAIGVVPFDPDEGDVRDLRLAEGRLTLHLTGGGFRSVPFHTGFFQS